MLAAKDDKYWTEHVKERATAWLAQGGRGAPKPADVEYAAQHLPGMRANLTPDQDKGDRKRERSGTPEWRPFRRHQRKPPKTFKTAQNPPKQIKTPENTKHTKQKTNSYINDTFCFFMNLRFPLFYPDDDFLNMDASVMRKFYLL